MKNEELCNVLEYFSHIKCILRGCGVEIGDHFLK
jgi:hypothetical protein